MSASDTMMAIHGRYSRLPDFSTWMVISSWCAASAADSWLFVVIFSAWSPVGGITCKSSSTPSGMLRLRLISDSRSAICGRDFFTR